jgi:hypothetical protein
MATVSVTIKNETLSLMLLSMATLNIQYRFAVFLFCYVECHNFLTVMLRVIMLSFIMLKVVKLSVIIQSLVVLRVVMLSVIRHSFAILSVTTKFCYAESLHAE